MSKQAQHEREMQIVYDMALEQYQEETDFGKKDFDESVAEHGYGYITYYYKRAIEVRS